MTIIEIIMIKNKKKICKYKYTNSWSDFVNSESGTLLSFNSEDFSSNLKNTKVSRVLSVHFNFSFSSGSFSSVNNFPIISSTLFPISTLKFLRHSLYWINESLSNFSALVLLFELILFFPNLNLDFSSPLFIMSWYILKEKKSK